MSYNWLKMSVVVNKFWLKGKERIVKKGMKKVLPDNNYFHKKEQHYERFPNP